MAVERERRKRIWLAVQIGRTLFAVWPFALRAEAYRQRDGVLMLGIGLSDRP